MAVFKCARISRGWYCDRKARRRDTVFRSQEFDACYPDWKQKTLNRIRHIGWFKLQSRGWSGGGQNRNLRMGHHLFGFRRRMHTLLISNGLQKGSKTEDPCGEIHFTGWFRSIEGSWMAAGMLLIDIGRHWGSEWRFGTIVRWMATRPLGGFSNFPMAERHISANACLQNLRSIPSLTKMNHQMRRSCSSMKVIKPPCLMHLLIKRQCYSVRCQAKFVIWSGGSQSVLQIIWIFSTCMQIWATMGAQKCSSNCKIREIPLCS